jgi:hypothetical protein
MSHRHRLREFLLRIIFEEFCYVPHRKEEKSKLLLSIGVFIDRALYCRENADQGSDEFSLVIIIEAIIQKQFGNPEKLQKEFNDRIVMHYFSMMCAAEPSRLEKAQQCWILILLLKKTNNQTEHEIFPRLLFKLLKREVEDNEIWIESSHFLLLDLAQSSSHLPF